MEVPHFSPFHAWTSQWRRYFQQIRDDAHSKVGNASDLPRWYQEPSVSSKKERAESSPGRANSVGDGRDKLSLMVLCGGGIERIQSTFTPKGSKRGVFDEAPIGSTPLVVHYTSSACTSSSQIGPALTRICMSRTTGARIAKRSSHKNCYFVTQQVMLFSKKTVQLLRVSSV